VADGRAAGRHEPVPANVRTAKRCGLNVVG
jgi:hypothetical protein